MGKQFLAVLIFVLGSSWLLCNLSLKWQSIFFVGGGFILLLGLCFAIVGVQDPRADSQWYDDGTECVTMDENGRIDYDELL